MVKGFKRLLQLSFQCFQFKFHRHVFALCALLAATKQLYEWFSPSVRPSVCLSIHVSVTPLSLCSHSHIMQFSGVITNGKSDVSSKGQGQRSSPQRSKLNLAVFGLKLQFLFIDGYEMMLKLEVAYKRCPNVFQCQCQISRSHETKTPILTKNWHLRTVTPVWIHQWLPNDAQSLN